MTGQSTAIQPLVRRLRASLRRRDLLVGAWMLATVVAYYHNFLVTQSLALSYGYAVGSYGVGLVYARYDATVRHLLAIGTIGGFVELLGDHFLVQSADTLVYPSGYPVLVSSPAYMPFAWAILITFMGYVGVRLGAELGRTAGYVGPAVFAFVAESGYESLASEGGGWVYTHAPLGWIGHAPLFIVVAEAVMFATVYYWSRRGVLLGGLGIGLTINVAYVGVYYAFVLLAAI